MRCPALAIIPCLLLLISSGAHAQILDDFESSDGGWRQGVTSLPLESNAGEEGTGDTALRVVSSVPGGPGGRIVIINTQGGTGRWTGDWTAAGRDRVFFRIRNNTGVQLHMRVGIEGTPFTERWVTSSAVIVSASTDWQNVEIDTSQSAFVADVGTDLNGTYRNVTHMRIFHNPGAAWRGAPLAGAVFFDDISDRPLPATCGNDTVDAAGEQCDGTDLDGETCLSQGFDAGSLSCSASCTFETNNCSSCGDSVCAPSETIATCPADCALRDTFGDGTTAGWQADPAGPATAVVADSGPEGVGDNALQVVPGMAQQRLVTFNSTQWTGDYFLRGRTVLFAHVKNIGPAEVDLRVVVNGPGGPFASETPVTVAANSGYRVVSWGLEEIDLRSVGGTSPAGTLSDVTELRVVHAPALTFDGAPINTTLLLDNISDLEPDPLCGDGVVNAAGEVCDDGNLVDGDGCSTTCQLEPRMDAGASDAGAFDAGVAADAGTSGGGGSNCDAGPPGKAPWRTLGICLLLVALGKRRRRGV